MKRGSCKGKLETVKAVLRTVNHVSLGWNAEEPFVIPYILTYRVLEVILERRVNTISCSGRSPFQTVPS